MCGIIGVISKRPLANRAWLSIGRDFMWNRGPDDAGEWWSEDGTVGLGHRRLSILDLSYAGHQPMLHSSGMLNIVFNGEIYNHNDLRHELIGLGHSFVSKTDTEVILCAYWEWGLECLKKLNGMFVFALYDFRQKSLFLARDRAGEKPVFYSFHNKELRFSSELKGLLADPELPRRINQDSLDCYLTMGYIPGERCILEGFNKLSPGHALLFNMETGRFNKWQYWDIPALEIKSDSFDEVALLDELESLLEDSVRRQILADVPVGILLSGGVDSSLIAAMAVRSSSCIQTFTIGFPGHKKHDETNHARLIASYFGTKHTELMAEDASADLIPRLAHQFDEPMADSSMIPTFLVSQLVRQSCKVALGGDGGDELFGGYGHYSRLKRLKVNLQLVPLQFSSCFAFMARKILPTGMKGRNWLQALEVNLSSGLPLINSFFDAPMRASLMSKTLGWSLVGESIFRDSIKNHDDLLQRATRTDFKNYLAEDILVKVDRASMLNSLEIRAPFLDYRLIEFAFSKVPSSLKVNQMEKKILLKRLADRVLPVEFDRQRKQGFSIPLAEWLKSGLFKKLFNEVLRDPNCTFELSAVENLFRGQDNGLNNGERLFSLVLFELWRKEHRVQI